MVTEENKKLGQHIVQVGEFYAGIIPHPRHLEAYEKIYPGAAKIILDMAQSQTKHRQSLETKVIGSNIFNERLGMGLAFVLSFSFALLGFILIFSNKNVPVGFFTLLAPMILQGANFFYRKQATSRELAARKKETKHEEKPHQ